MLADELAVQIDLGVVGDGGEAQHQALVANKGGNRDGALIEHPAVMVAKVDALLQVVIGGGDGHGGGVFKRAVLPAGVKARAVVQLKVPDAA